MYVAIDIETTGLDFVSDQIIEIGAVKFDENGIAEEFSTLVNPNIQIPPEVTRLTGITQEDIRSAPQVYEAAEILKSFIADLPLIVHYADFDIEMLKRRICDLANPHYDTLVLSQIFIKNMRSYSLESLAKNLKLVHDQKHRALSDAKATAALFQLILKEIKNTGVSELEKMNAVLKKSNWYGKNLFMGTGAVSTPVKRQAEQPIAAAAILEKSEKSPAEKKICEALKQNKKTTFELSPRIDAEQNAVAAAEEFAKTSEERVLIAMRWPKNPTIFGKGQYLSVNRFKKFLEKDHFDDKETVFAIKIILWQPDTIIGAKQELNLVREEHSLWEKVCCDDFECPHNRPRQRSMETNCFYNRTLDNMKDKKVWIVSHKTLLGEIDAGDAKLILCDFDEIGESASIALSTVFYSSRIKGLIDNEILRVKAEVLFGLLWRVVEQNTNIEEGKYAEITVNASHKTSPLWQQIKGTALFMEEMIAKEKPNKFLAKLALLIDVILDKNTDHEMEIHRKYSEEIKVVLTPKNLVELTEQKISEACKNPIFIGIFDSADEKIKSEPAPTEIFYLFEDFRKFNRDALFNASANLLQHAIIKNNGRTICVFHSKMALRGAYEAIYEEMKKRGIAIHCQEISGGRGKIIDNYIRNPENSALFILEYYFRQINLEELDFNQIIINKFYSGPDKSEQDFLLDIKKAFNKILSAQKAKRILVLDPFVVPLAEKIKASMVDEIDIRVTKSSQLTFDI
ncbi:3'-5' exoribonuclease [Candidatus Peregrinibacteria bacterium]|nr:3'-5' exoribonuclease [Candidatus Peregrinibacteria bacterium]